VKKSNILNAFSDKYTLLVNKICILLFLRDVAEGLAFTALTREVCMSGRKV